MKTLDKNPQPAFLGIIPHNKFGMLIQCAEEIGLVEDDLIAFLEPKDADGDVIENHILVYMEEKNMIKSGPLWDKYQTRMLTDFGSNGSSLEN